MSWLVRNIKSVMLVTGLLTCTMLFAALAPQAALRSTFGEALEGPVAEVVVRNWGVLITLVGGMLIYGAYVAAVRPLALIVAALGKLAFIGLVLAQGERYIKAAGVVLAADLTMVILFAAYLAAARKEG